MGMLSLMKGFGPEAASDLPSATPGTGGDAAAATRPAAGTKAHTSDSSSDPAAGITTPTSDSSSDPPPSGGAIDYGKLSIEKKMTRQKDENMVISKDRHAAPYSAAPALTKHMRRNKLIPEGLGNQARHV
jgi:hypothetical protein